MISTHIVSSPQGALDKCLSHHLSLLVSFDKIKMLTHIVGTQKYWMDEWVDGWTKMAEIGVGRVYRLWGAKQKFIPKWITRISWISALDNLGLYAAYSLNVLTTFMPWGARLKNAVVSFSRPFAGRWWWWDIVMKGRAKCVGFGENRALGQATWCSGEWEQTCYCLCGLGENSSVSLGLSCCILKMGWSNLPGMVCFVVYSNKIP